MSDKITNGTSSGNVALDDADEWRAQALEQLVADTRAGRRSPEGLRRAFDAVRSPDMRRYWVHSICTQFADTHEFYIVCSKYEPIPDDAVPVQVRSELPPVELGPPAYDPEESDIEPPKQVLTIEGIEGALTQLARQDIRFRKLTVGDVCAVLTRVPPGKRAPQSAPGIAAELSLTCGAFDEVFVHGEQFSDARERVADHFRKAVKRSAAVFRRQIRANADRLERLSMTPAVRSGDD